MAADGKFYVNDLQHLVDSKITCSADNPTIWLKSFPLKVVMFIWRACMDRMPSDIAFIRRGVNISFSSCADSSDHLLASCPFIQEVLFWILKWYDVRSQNFNSVLEVLIFAANWKCCSKKRMIFIAIIYRM